MGAARTRRAKRLLELAAAAARDGAHPLDGLFGARGTAAPTPVYRVELPRGHQAFAVADGDDWAAVTSVAALDPDEVAVEVAAAAAAAAESGRDALVERDARLTALLTERAACAAGRSDRRSLGPAAPRDQYYVNRNELFNARLAVTNIVLDVDFRLKRPLPAETCTEPCAASVAARLPRSRRCSPKSPPMPGPHTPASSTRARALRPPLAT